MEARLRPGSLELVLDALVEPVKVTDADGVIVFTNAAGAERFGWDKYVGLSLPERLARLRVFRLDGTPLPEAEYPVVRVLRSGTPVIGATLVMETEAAGRRSYVMNTVPLREAGRMAGTVSVLHDMTEWLQLREELETARTRAEEASRLKDQFIAALSHELRAPLQPILGWTEVLRRHGGADDITARAAEAIRRNIRQQVRLVDDLLDLSRIVHRKLALRYEIFDLCDQVRAAAEPFEETAALKGVRFSVSLPGMPLPIWGDGSRVQQIAINLVSNAVKFTPAGGRVAVRLSVQGEHALLEVEDTGQGIAAEDLPFIFDAFRQGERTRRQGGLGLGLDLVRRLTEMHSGSVEAFSEGPGRGARFGVRLPLARLEAGAAPGGPAATRRLEQRSILVIEDNADTRDVLKFMLEMEGARVETADAGVSGVEAVEAFRPSVVLCDIGLPDIDGLEVARRIRERPDLAATRLIALTGYGQAEDLRRAIEAGFDAHLIKPVNLDELLELLAD